MATHTPGPWEIDTHHGIAIRGETMRVCRVPIYASPAQIRVADANARLIAAAPELLRALEAMILNTKNDGGEYRDCYKNAVAAVAKATGNAKC